MGLSLAHISTVRVMMIATISATSCATEEWTLLLPIALCLAIVVVVVVVVVVVAVTAVVVVVAATAGTPFGRVIVAAVPFYTAARRRCGRAAARFLQMHPRRRR
jgi:hypothetical protein